MQQSGLSSLHQGVALESVGSTKTDTGLELRLVRVQRGRDDFSYGLHAYPTTFTLSGGFDSAGLLGRAGFRGMQACSFTSGRECAVKEVGTDFDLDTAAKAYAEAERAFHTADQLLQRCGFTIGPGEASGQRWLSTSGDGHTGSNHQSMKSHEDEGFRYELTWMEDRQGGGWTTHYIPKDDEAGAILGALAGLKSHRECMTNNFDPCFWRRHLRAADGRMDFGNNDYIFGYFDAHPANLLQALRLVAQGDELLRGH